ncbi:hypothetical protein SAMN05216565_11026 [Litchfieldia salsa]|uniref:Uncharacterized protein n=1 Tax=Litchfieldia salsa TaxID=930152 RepID=A0A1H0WB50_9BACI|nr:hypothetical protein SAMN05216565_11026 [Litchfieldia salsa]
MKLREIIKDIQNLDETEQYRLKEFFNQSLASFSASEPVFKEISDQKHKKGYTCTYCKLANAVRFGKYKVKVGLKLMERQRYRCKDCQKTFTDTSNTPIYRTHKPHKWLDFIQCYRM